MTLPSFSDLRLSLDEHVATIEIASGPMNFLSISLLKQLVAVWEWADAEPDCRAIVLCAAGPVFCAGANFMDFASSEPNPNPEPMYRLAQRLLDGRKPLIAAVQGAAVGAGLGLAMIADERVAGPRARFVANFVSLGFHPGFGLTATLPWAIGAQRATAFLMTGQRLGPDDALRMGLVDEVAPAETLVDVARRRAQAIASNAPIAVQDLRQTMRRALNADFTQAVNRELEMQLQHFRTADFAEGVGAMLSKKTPLFRNR
jgi:enoyl-CoA hydratase/carnithine racemase